MNEKTYIEDCLKEKRIDVSKVFTFLSIYSRYLFHEEEKKKTEIISILNEHMESYYPRYNPVEWVNYIEQCANKAHAYPLCKCDCVAITQKEIDTITAIDDKVLERLAFALLCLAKFNNFRNAENNNWINYSNGEIYSMACITASAFNKNIRFYDLKQLGLIEYATRVDNLNIRVLFVDNCTENIKLQIKDFRKLGYEWKVYQDSLLDKENYIRCADCGVLVRKTSNNKKYCSTCVKGDSLSRETNIKEVQCVDCGDIFEVPAKNTKTVRCKVCQDLHKKKYLKQYMKDRRNSKNIS